MQGLTHPTVAEVVRLWTKRSNRTLPPDSNESGYVYHERTFLELPPDSNESGYVYHESVCWGSFCRVA